MNAKALIEQFSHRVNAGLVTGRDDSVQAYGALRSSTEESGEGALLDQMRDNFHDALHPTQFTSERVWRVNDQFEQIYELLRQTFDEAELDTRERFIAMVNALHDQNNPAPIILMGRSWHVSGLQEYGVAGALQHFMYDPLTVTKSIASVLNANYMTLEPTGRQGVGIGAIGHLATREHLRRSHGLGSALLSDFEREVASIAASRSARVVLVALEAQADSQVFWYKRGYRWASDTRYAQPPLDFDPVTGERRHDEVPETLMVKIPGQPDATSVDAGLLADAVRVMYQNWCLAKVQDYPPAAARRATDYVFGKVFAEFMASLPANSARVRLTPPPSLL